MGLRDTEEMLEAAKADAVTMERQIADQQDRLDRIARLALEVNADTRVEILATAAGIDPADAYRQLREATGLPAPTDTEEDPGA